MVVNSTQPSHFLQGVRAPRFQKSNDATVVVNQASTLDIKTKAQGMQIQNHLAQVHYPSNRKDNHFHQPYAPNSGRRVLPLQPTLPTSTTHSMLPTLGGVTDRPVTLLLAG